MHRLARDDESMHNKLVYAGAELRQLWSVFAEAFKAEARELDLPVHPFSLPAFINFICLQFDGTVQSARAGGPARFSANSTIGVT